MLKATLRQVIEAGPGLQMLSSVKLPIKAAYAVGKLAAAFSRESEHYSQLKDKVFKEAGCRIDKNQWTHDDPEVMERCIKEVEELAAADVELAALPLDLEQFGNAEVPAHALMHLDWAIKHE